MLMVRLLIAFISLSSFAQSLKHPIAAIDFYGSASVDLVQLRAAFPYRVGAQYEPVKELRLADLPLEFQRLVGQNRFSYAPILVPNPPRPGFLRRYRTGQFCTSRLEEGTQRYGEIAAGNRCSV